MTRGGVLDDEAAGEQGDAALQVDAHGEHAEGGGTAMPTRIRKSIICEKERASPQAAVERLHPASPEARMNRRG